MYQSHLIISHYSLIKCSGKIQRTSEAHISAPEVIVELPEFIFICSWVPHRKKCPEQFNFLLSCFALDIFFGFSFFFCPRYSVGNSLSQHLVEADHQSQHFPASVHRGENDGLSYLHFLIIYTRHPCTTSARILVSPNLHCIFWFFSV